MKKSGLDDLAGLDAGGADAHALAAAIHLGFDFLEVGIPATPGGVVRVRDVVSELRTFAAKLTFLCHDVAPILYACADRQGVRLQ